MCPMPAMSINQLDERYGVELFDQGFVEAYSLRRILAAALWTADIPVTDSVATAIHLSALGNTWLGRLQSEFPGLMDNEAKLAVFLNFFQQDLLVDIGNTDMRELERFITA